MHVNMKLRFPLLWIIRDPGELRNFPPVSFRYICPYFTLAYAANDVVLIVMWTMAAKEDISYLSVIICFVMFLVNDLYGFVSWKRMEKRQMAAI